MGVTAKLNKKIDISKVTEEQITIAIEGLAMLFEGEAKKRTPVLTGRLKNSIVGKRTGRLEGQVSTNVKYAEFVEFGTAKMQPRSMIRGAAGAMEKIGTEFLQKQLSKNNLTT